MGNQNHEGQISVGFEGLLLPCLTAPNISEKGYLLDTAVVEWHVKRGVGMWTSSKAIPKFNNAEK